jgi:hypothetical protein
MLAIILCYNLFINNIFLIKISMDDFEALEKKCLVDDLGVKKEDLFEARFNLLGFFEVLYRIDQRLQNKKVNN